MATYSVIRADSLKEAGTWMGISLARRQDHDAHSLLGIMDNWCALCVRAQWHRQLPVAECGTCQSEGLMPKFGLKGSRKPRITH